MSRDPEEARDLVQEAFLRAARHPGSVPEEESRAEAWLVRVLVNLCRDRFRRRKVRNRTAAAAPPPEPEANPEAAYVAGAEVRSALARLPPRRRAVIVLHELEDRPVREIARLLHIREVTVRWHLARARRELRVRLSSLLGSAAR